MRRYAIVWAKGDEVYTHAADDGTTITYERKELDDLFKIDDLPTLNLIKERPGQMIGVPVDDLNRLLGISV